METGAEVMLLVNAPTGFARHAGGVGGWGVVVILSPTLHGSNAHLRVGLLRVLLS